MFAKPWKSQSLFFLRKAFEKPGEDGTRKRRHDALMRRADAAADATAANATAAVYARSQAGMLDIIQKARALGLVRRVAFLEPDVVYRFDAVRLFPVAKNTWGGPWARKKE